jgi:hypothetical protein
MEDQLQQIRAALEASASPEARQAGIEACRAITAAIEAAAPRPPTTPSDLPPAAPAAQEEASQPVVAELCDPRDVPPAEAATAPPTPSTSPAPHKAAAAAATPSIGGIEPAAMAAIVATLRSLTPDQWLDLIIEKLMAATRAMPAAAPVPQASPVAAILPPAAPQPLRFQMVSIPAASPRAPNRRR